MITVFTPTYNRALLLPRCYKSLLKQTKKDFKWLIVDDGSTDDTEALIKKWQEEKKIEITYIKQSNGGKHVAHNTGVIQCDTELFICLDSDDFLTEDAIAYWQEYEDEILQDEHLAGMALPKGDENGRIMGRYIPGDKQRASIKALYQKYHFKGELALVFKTDILKRYLFPVFEGEKFVGESVVYDRISQKYEMLLKNKIVYLCEYTVDGYTNNVTALYARNPKGYVYFLKQNIQLAEGVKERLQAVALYTSGCWRICYKEWFREAEEKKVIILTLPWAMIKYFKVKIKTSLFSLRIRELSHQLKGGQ